MKQAKAILFMALFAASSAVSAIIIRDDVKDEKYRISPSELPALADFPGEGHGVLIAPQWVVTAAHVACMQPFKEIMVNGLPRKVASVIVHPGYKTLPDSLVNAALASGDGVELREFLASSDDIALIKLQAAVTDVEPVPLFRGRNEIGRTIKLIGKGATGTGSGDLPLHSPRRTTLRRAFNIISSVNERWISYRFDSPAFAVPLEGMAGNGDSGSPVLVEENRQWQLAGLVAWVSSDRDLRTFRGARYGDGGNNLRISHYTAWIERTIIADQQDEAAAKR